MVTDRVSRESGHGPEQSSGTPPPLDRLPPAEADPWRENFGTFFLYAVAILAYALLGMYWHFLLSWTRGFIFAFVAIWLFPMLYRRWRS